MDENKSDIYAAIYARTSGKKSTGNSILAQIEQCEELALKEKLLVYDSYIDEVSGKSQAPEQRKGYKKLLIDAKNGCFKSLIIYRYDRLVRNYDDWIVTSKELRKLGINILLADKTQPVCSNKPNEQFLTNLMVLFSDFEPDSIKQRTKEGRDVLRRQGMYISKEAFGFTKKIEEKRACYQGIPVCKEFIIFIFNEFYDKCREDEVNYQEKIKDIYIMSCNLMISLKNKFDVKENIGIDYGVSNFNKFIKEIENYDKNTLKVGFMKLEEYFAFEKGNKKHLFMNVLKNNIYSGFMLKEPKGDKNPLNGFKENENEELVLDPDAFIKSVNVESIINEKIFLKVYSLVGKRELVASKEYRPFLLKEKFRCKCKGRLILEEINIISCSNGCFSIFYDEFIRYILKLIVTNTFSTKNVGIKNFEYKLQQRVFYLNNDLDKLILNKSEILKKFMITDDFSILDLNKIIIEKEEVILDQKRTINKYVEQIDNINKFKGALTCHNTKNKCIDILVDYILKKENLFEVLLNEVINMIYVGVEKDKGNFRTKVTYEFEQG